MFDFFAMTLEKWGLNHAQALAGAQGLAIGLTLALSLVAYAITRKIILRVVAASVKRTRNQLDDLLLQRKVFDRLSHIAPAAVVHLMARVCFPEGSDWVGAVQNAASIYMVIIVLWVIDAVLNALVDASRTTRAYKKLPLRIFSQVAKIIIFSVGAIFVLSMILGESPKFFLGSLGAMTAILMLVFKDSILGLVAGIQLAANNMVQVGDWIEMPKYGADGDVLEVALTTVKVQNWDKTISTIPTYALISDSFKNWRGMSESGGRRIKRALNIDMNSVRFCDPAMLERFEKIELLREYLSAKQKEIDEHNRSLGVDLNQTVNGRRLTNLGTFRAYVVSYLRRHPMIHQQMTFLVRHLQPTAQGLPLEIYVFSKDQVWANYEAIQADIFDHLLAVLPEFGLRVFQDPTGADFVRLLQHGE